MVIWSQVMASVKVKNRALPMVPGASKAKAWKEGQIRVGWCGWGWRWRVAGIGQGGWWGWGRVLIDSELRESNGDQKWKENGEKEGREEFYERSLTRIKQLWSWFVSPTLILWIVSILFLFLFVSHIVGCKGVKDPYYMDISASQCK